MSSVTFSEQTGTLLEERVCHWLCAREGTERGHDPAHAGRPSNLLVTNSLTSKLLSHMNETNQSKEST